MHVLGTGMVKKAEELSKKHGWFLTSQFDNPANPAYHASTTGPEILQDFASLDLDYWVTGYGTGGTLSGAGKVIKTARPDVKIIATEPTEAALLSGSEWKPHKIQVLRKSSYFHFVTEIESIIFKYRVGLLILLLAM